MENLNYFGINTSLRQINTTTCWFNWRGMPILCHKCQWFCCVQPQLLAAAVLQVSRVVLRYANWRPPVLQADERWLQVLSGRQAHWGMQDETQVTQCRPDCKLIFIFIPLNLRQLFLIAFITIRDYFYNSVLQNCFVLFFLLLTFV